MGALRWEDINFENKIVYIRHSLNCQYYNGKKNICITSPKTKNSYRKVPFFGETKKVLLAQREKQKILREQLKDRWREVEGITNLVFTSSMGSTVTRHVLEHDMKTISNQINMTELYQAQEEG